MALEVAGRSMFSVGMDRHGPELRAFIEPTAVRIGRPHILDVLMPPGWAAPLDWPRAQITGRRWIPFLIRSSRLGPQSRHGRGDLLDLLAAARNRRPGCLHGGGVARSGRDDDPRRPRDHGGTLFWASYMLALFPDVQERVAAEARAADLSDPTGCHTDGRLPLTRAVIDETLRLYPAAFVVVRRALGRTRSPATRSRRATSSSPAPGCCTGTGVSGSIRTPSIRAASCPVAKLPRDSATCRSAPGRGSASVRNSR